MHYTQLFLEIYFFNDFNIFVKKFVQYKKKVENVYLLNCRGINRLTLCFPSNKFNLWMFILYILLSTPLLVCLPHVQDVQ